MVENESRFRTPLDFYIEAVRSGALRRGDGTIDRSLLESFERFYSGHLCRFPGDGSGVEIVHEVCVCSGRRCNPRVGVDVLAADGGCTSGQLCQDSGLHVGVNSEMLLEEKKNSDCDAFGNSCHEEGGQSSVLEEDGCKKKTNVPGAFGNSCHEKGDQNVGGVNVKRNREWRKEKKERKQKKKEKWNEIGKMRGVVDSGVKDASPFSLNSLVRDQNVELRNSLAAKWKAENALAKLRAERQFAVLSASDLQDEVKQHRTKLNATIERNMVSIEKTHATLRATGNVAGEFHGSAETVMTPGLSSGTISPDSSASMQEFRAVQKRNLDLENKIKIATEKLGVDIEHIDLYDKEIWTNNSVNEAILDKMYPDGYGMDGTFYDEGKVRVIPT